MDICSCNQGRWQLLSYESQREYIVCFGQDLAYILAVGYVAVSILLSGFFVRPTQLVISPLLWLSYISYPRSATTLSTYCLHLHNI